MLWHPAGFEGMLAASMTLYLNGEPRELPGPVTLPELVRSLGLPEAALLVEHNGLALLRHEWEGRTLADGDRLELLRLTAGG